MVILLLGNKLNPVILYANLVCPQALITVVPAMVAIFYPNIPVCHAVMPMLSLACQLIKPFQLHA